MKGIFMEKNSKRIGCTDFCTWNNSRLGWYYCAT